MEMRYYRNGKELTMKCIGLVVLVLVAMIATVAVKAGVHNNKRFGIVGAVIGTAASASVLTGVYVAAHHILS